MKIFFAKAPSLDNPAARRWQRAPRSQRPTRKVHLSTRGQSLTQFVGSSPIGQEANPAFFMINLLVKPIDLASVITYVLSIMKRDCIIITCAGLCLISCGGMNAPLATSGDFDPLRAPGSNLPVSISAGPSFRAGQFVKSSMDNTTFFKSRPTGSAEADKILKRATSMKVISTAGSYLKVELDGGEVGFVPTVMVEDPAMAPAMAGGGPGEFQVYPPMPSGPGDMMPIIPPSELPPGNAIPAIMDPEAPAIDMPIVPEATTPPNTFGTPPVVPTTPPPGEVDVTPQIAPPSMPPASAPAAELPPTSVTPAPLPPNQEDLKKAAGSQPAPPSNAQ